MGNSVVLYGHLELFLTQAWVGCIPAAHMPAYCGYLVERLMSCDPHILRVHVGYTGCRVDVILADETHGNAAAETPSQIRDRLEKAACDVRIAFLRERDITPDYSGMRLGDDERTTGL